MIYNRAFHRSVYFNQRVYVFGGLHMNNETKKEVVLKACEYFNPVNNQWTEIQPLKFER